MLIRDCREHKDCDRSDLKEINGISQAQRSVVCEKRKIEHLYFFFAQTIYFSMLFCYNSKKTAVGGGGTGGVCPKNQCCDFYLLQLKKC